MEFLRNDNLVVNIFKTISNRGGMLLCSLITTVMLARSLEPEKLGYYTVAISIYTVCFQIVNMGMHSAHSFFLSQNLRLFPKVWGNSLFISCGSGLVIVLYAFASLFTDSFMGLSNNLVLIALGIVPVYLLNYYQSEIFIIINDIRFYNFLNLSVAVLTLAGTVFLWAMKKSEVMLFLWLQIGVFIFASLMGALRIRIKHKVKPHPSFQLFKEAIPISAKTCISCLLAYLVMRLNIFVVQYFLTGSDTGHYSLATNLADIVNIFGAVFSSLLFPQLMALVERHDRAALTTRLVKILTMVLILVAIVAIIGGYWLIPFIYGESYRPSYWLLLVILPGVILWGIIKPIIAFFNSYKRFELAIYAAALALVVDIIANVVFIPVLGVTGVALAASLSYLSSFIFWNILFRKQQRLIVQRRTDNETPR